MEDIVAAIDELAYSLHTSRSNLINQILAEKVELVTPKQQLQSIFEQLSECLSPYQHFQVQNQAADHMYSVKSALRYRYNPTIRYCLYLIEKNHVLEGELRVVSRTQSDLLHHYLNHFFQTWSAIENRYQKALWKREEKAKWLRILDLDYFQGAREYSELAPALSDYIHILDKGIKLYFLQIEKGYEDMKELAKCYDDYCKEHSVMI